MDIRLAAAYVKLGQMWQIPREDLPGIAMKAVQAGMDSPALSILAGETEPHWSEAYALLERAIYELGLVFPTRREAALYVAWHYAQVIYRQSAPTEYAAEQVAQVLDLGPETPKEIRAFVRAAREYWLWRGMELEAEAAHLVETMWKAAAKKGGDF